MLIKGQKIIGGGGGGVARCNTLTSKTITASWAPTFAQLNIYDAIIVNNPPSNTVVTLPSADTVPNDGLMRRYWIHNESSTTKKVTANPALNDFADGLDHVHIPPGRSIQLGVRYSATAGWHRLSNIESAEEVERSAIWLASNFATPTAIPFDVLNIEDNSSVDSWRSSAPTRVSSGYKRRRLVNYDLTIDSTGGGTWTVAAWIEKNGTKIDKTETRTGNYGNEDQSCCLTMQSIDVDEGDYIELVLDHSNLTGRLLKANLRVSSII